GDPSARTSRDFQSERIEGPAELVRRILGVWVQRIHVPTSVAVPHPFEALEGGAESRVVPIAKGGEHVQADEDIVVVMNRVVKPEPRTVRSRSLADESALEIELGAPLDRLANLGSARGLRDRRESGEGLPAVQRPSGGAEAVPSAIFLLVVDEPVDGGPQAGILQVSESSEHPHRVPGEAQLTPG